MESDGNTTQEPRLLPRILRSLPLGRWRILQAFILLHPEQPGRRVTTIMLHALVAHINSHEDRGEKLYCEEDSESSSTLLVDSLLLCWEELYHRRIFSVESLFLLLFPKQRYPHLLSRPPLMQHLCLNRV